VPFNHVHTNSISGRLARCTAFITQDVRLGPSDHEPTVQSQEQTGERHLEERRNPGELELLVARFLCRQEVSTAAREPGLQLWLSKLLCVSFVVFVGGLLGMKE
jgi:hypothetical protein